MRPYTSQFVKKRLMPRRLSTAACPFPGKAPLRMYFRHNDEVYHGKFNAPIWRHFFAKRKEKAERVFCVYDKAGAVLWGTDPVHIQVESGTILYRYFACTWLLPHNLKRVIPVQIGTYWLYLDDADPGQIGRPLDRTRWLHYVNSSVPHLRTI